MEMKIRKKYVLRLPSNLQKRVVMLKIAEGDKPDRIVRKAISEIVATTDKSQVKTEGIKKKNIIHYGDINNFRL